MNLLAFLFHRVLYLGDEVYQRSRERLGRRERFYNALRYTFSRFLHEKPVSLYYPYLGRGA